MLSKSIIGAGGAKKPITTPPTLVYGDAYNTAGSVPALAGDIIFIVESINTTTPPALLSGYTNLFTISSTRSLRAQYKVLTSNQTVSIPAPAYLAWVGQVRNWSAIGNTAGRGVASQSTTITFPTISVSQHSLILAGPYYYATIYPISNIPTQFVGEDSSPAFIINYDNTLYTTTAGLTATYPVTLWGTSWIIEVLGT